MENYIYLEELNGSKVVLWKKRSTEKSLASERAKNSLTDDRETEEQELIMEKKAQVERDINSRDCKEVKMRRGRYCRAGWERETICLKKDVDKVSEQKAACEERLRHLDAALKECMQQLHFIRQEQEKRIRSAVIKTLEEFEKTRIALNDNLIEADRRIARLDAENTRFQRALSGKDKLIEELSKYTAQVEADLNALMLRVKSTEKENASLKYEVRVLEKEINIRSEEGEVNRRAADISQKQHKESVKKIAKLESECQRLRLLVCRRLPGPTALTKMKNEVEMLGKDNVETRRRISNPSMDFCVDLGADTPSKRINFLTEQLLKMKEEKRALNTKPRLSSQVEESFKGQTTIDFLREEHSLGTLSDLDSDDKISCAESALISELENFKNEKQSGTPSNRYMGALEMNLMDDFAEMEKLALDYPAASSHHLSDEGNAVIDPTGSKSFNLEVSGTGYEKDISSTKKNDQKLESNVSIPIRKILELLEGINLPPQDNGAAESFPGKDDKLLLDKSLGYIVRVFQWRTDELSILQQQLYQTCRDLSNGKADPEQFVQLVASSLDWIMNHCFSLQDVSSMKDAIRSRLDWDEWRSESGEDSGSANYYAESTQLNIQRQDASCIPVVSPLNGHNTSHHLEALQPNQKAEANLGSDLEGGFQSQIVKGDKFSTCLQASEEIIENLKSEKETTRTSTGKTRDQIVKPKMMKQGLEIQRLETNLEHGKAFQKISHMENDLENTNSTFDREEVTCKDQKTQPQSTTNKEGQDDGNPLRKQLRNDWEIATASENLAECQETLLNLGKQLKALASPREAAIVDKVISTSPEDHVITSTPTTSRRIVSKRLSLQDKMLEEDKDQIGNYSSTVSTNAAVESWDKFTNPNGIARQEDTIVSMAIVPHKRSESRSLLTKLFLWKKEGNRKKTPFF